MGGNSAEDVENKGVGWRVEDRDFGLGGVTRCRDLIESVKREELGNCGCGKLRERTDFTTEDTEFTEGQGGKSRAKGLPWEARVVAVRRSVTNNIHYYNMDVNRDYGIVRTGWDSGNKGRRVSQLKS